MEEKKLTENEKDNEKQADIKKDPMEEVKISEKNDDATTKEAENQKTDESKENDDTSSDKGEDAESELEVMKKSAAEAHDRFLRVSAELENFKKRTAREMDVFRKYSNESLIKEILPVLDNLERAIEMSKNGHAEKTEDEVESAARLLEGVELTRNEILKIFEKYGVKPIEALGKDFDPEFHEAVMQEESEEFSENKVMKEFQKGYTMHDRLIRPSMVVVSKTKMTAEKK